MIVKSLNLENFRNFASLNLAFNDSINLFYGKNGSGKTNILESIFVLLLARSFRGVADNIMVNDESDYYRIEGKVFSDNRELSLASAYQKGRRKRITIEELPTKASELFERFTAVSAGPGDIEILSGSPSVRREFLNIYLSQASIKYLDNLGKYQKTLAQKNAFLKQDNNQDETPYDDLLTEYGSSIILARKQFIEKINKLGSIHYGEISGGQSMSLKYKPSVPIDDEINEIDIIKTAFRGKIYQNRDRERIMQTSLVGPHRDDIDFIIRDMPARSHGSQGELRSAVVSVKLAVYEYLRELKKVKPILLLDEIFAELDNNRKEMLVSLFDRFGQIFLTSASGIPNSLESKADKFTIKNGAIDKKALK